MVHGYSGAGPESTSLHVLQPEPSLRPPEQGCSIVVQCRVGLQGYSQVLSLGANGSHTALLWRYYPCLRRAEAQTSFLQAQLAPTKMNHRCRSQMHEHLEEQLQTSAFKTKVAPLDRSLQRCLRLSCLIAREPSPAVHTAAFPCCPVLFPYVGEGGPEL